MITRITGKLVSVRDEALILEVGAFHYEVLIPDFVRRQLQNRIGEDVSLHTLEYLDGNPSHGRVVPRMVGFLSPIEREFFEMFCSVDGVGVKKALRAMVRPVREVAASIEDQDAKGLSALPGIGPAVAERVIAKLRRKVPKFALMVAREEPTEADISSDVISEAFEVLRQLGHSESDARRLLDGVLSEKKKFKDVQEVLHAVYQRNQK